MSAQLRSGGGGGMHPVGLRAHEGNADNHAENVSLKGEAGRRERPRPREAHQVSDRCCPRRQEAGPVLKCLHGPPLDAAGSRGRSLGFARWGGYARDRCRTRSYEDNDEDTPARLQHQRVTTNEVRNEPALPQETRIGQRPGVVLVPTFHVQDTRPPMGRFG